MKKFFAITSLASGLAVFGLAAGAIVLPAPSACACGETYFGKANFHWDEMSLPEKMIYRSVGTMPERFRTGVAE